MRYTTIYDLQALPAIDWRSMVFPVGLALVAAIAGYSTKPGSGRTGLFVFAILFVVLPVGIQLFNYYYLASKKPQVIEGLLLDYWRKDWTTRHDGKNEHHSQEGFQVDTVTFWYNRSQTAGFTNVEPVEYPLRNGLPVRIHYAPIQQITTGETINSIVKLEVVE